jgi:hypothetical protein
MDQYWPVHLVGLGNLEEKLLCRLLEVWAVEDDDSIGARTSLDPRRAQSVVANQ